MSKNCRIAGRLGLALSRQYLQNVNGVTDAAERRKAARWIEAWTRAWMKSKRKTTDRVVTPIAKASDPRRHQSQGLFR